MKLSHNKFLIIWISVLSLLIIIGLICRNALTQNDSKANEINSFAECAAAGNPIMESYPERCTAGGKTFTNPDQKIQNPPN